MAAKVRHDERYKKRATLRGGGVSHNGIDSFDIGPRPTSNGRTKSDKRAMALLKSMTVGSVQHLSPIGRAALNQMEAERRVRSIVASVGQKRFWRSQATTQKF